MLYGHASYCIGDEEWRTCRLGFFYFCFRDEKWMRDLKAMKAMKAESQQLCRCCWLWALWNEMWVV